MTNDETPIPANQRWVRTGGLMRCCLATLENTERDTVVGDTLSCEYESDPNNENMVVGPDGVWQWSGPRD